MTHPGKSTKPGFMYRSAEVASITDEGDLILRIFFATLLNYVGKEQVRRLGIKTVFDLRSDTEIKKYNAPLPTIEDVELLHVPVFQIEDYSPEMMAKRSWNSTLKFSITEVQLSARYYDSFAIILTMHAYFIVRLVKIGLGSWRLFCSNSQRSSTQTKLAGVDNVAIANDYSLTRVGREPAREKIMERLSKEPLFASNNEAALIMFTCREETMLAFLDLLDTKYGGVEEYIRNYTHLSESDIAVIRNNMLVSSHSLL
ncbi:hypothetical protein GG344DRAFT_63171 [Lentinula edodes]|nr:hypothetical protein GG344DRAFT_63171 [Lentinula edodes]